MVKFSLDCLGEFNTAVLQGHQDGASTSGCVLAPPSSVFAEGPETTGQSRPDLYPEIQQQAWRGIQIHVRQICSTCSFSTHKAIGYICLICIFKSISYTSDRKN